MARRALVGMNEQGRVTIPAAARRALGLAGEAQFECEVMDNAILLRPVAVVPREDAWAYAPEHLERLRRSAGQRGYRLSEDDLLEIAGKMEAARSESREYHPSDEELAALEAKHLAAEA